MQARAMVRDGQLGEIRLVQVEYVQGGKAKPVSFAGGEALPWRYDPVRGGPSLVMGDIGTHAHNLLRFITGVEVAEVAAEVRRWAEDVLRQLRERSSDRCLGDPRRHPPAVASLPWGRRAGTGSRQNSDRALESPHNTGGRDHDEAVAIRRRATGIRGDGTG